jgi:hypothetical protein
MIRAAKKIVVQKMSLFSLRDFIVIYSPENWNIAIMEAEDHWNAGMME